MAGNPFALSAPWVNVGDINESVIYTIIETLTAFLGRGVGETFAAMESWFVRMDPTNIATNTNGPFVWGKPTGCAGTEPVCALQDIRPLVFFDGSFDGQIVVLALVLVLVLLYARASMSIFGVGSRKGVFRTRRLVPVSVALIVAWYPIAVGFIALVNALALGFLDLGAPVSEFGAWMEGLSTDVGMNSMDLIGGDAVNPLHAIVVSLSGLLAAALYLAFRIRLVVIWLVLFAGPVLVALAYSGVPTLSRAGKGALTAFVGLVLLPLGVAIAMSAYVILFRASGGGINDLGRSVSAPFIVLSFEVIALFLCVRTVRLPSRVSTTVAVDDRVAVTDRVREVVGGARPGAVAEPVASGSEDVDGLSPRYRRSENEPGGRR